MATIDEMIGVLNDNYLGMEWSCNGEPTTQAEFDSMVIIHKANGHTPPTWSGIQPMLTTYQGGQLDRDLARLREKRNRLLAETDFYALSDVTMSDEMEAYRQDLRDLPSGLDTTQKVANVIFPTKP